MTTKIICDACLLTLPFNMICDKNKIMTLHTLSVVYMQVHADGAQRCAQGYTYTWQMFLKLLNDIANAKNRDTRRDILSIVDSM